MKKELYIGFDDGGAISDKIRTKNLSYAEWRAAIAYSKKVSMDTECVLRCEAWDDDYEFKNSTDLIFRRGKYVGHNFDNPQWLPAEAHQYLS